MISQFYNQLQLDNGNAGQALDDLAAKGKGDWSKLAADVQTANEQIQQTTQQQLVQGSMSAWDTIQSVYGSGTAAAEAALKTLSPDQQEVITDLQMISTQSGISMSDLEQLGAAGVINAQVSVNGSLLTVNGTLQDVVQQIEAANGATGTWGQTTQQVAAANDAAITNYMNSLGPLARELQGIANQEATDEHPVTVPVTSGQQPLTYDSGGVSTSAALAWVSGNGEPEAHIPQSMAGPMWPYLLGLLGGGPSSGGGGAGLASAAASMGAPAAGGGGGTVIQIGNITLQGISNPQDFLYELQNIVLSTAKGQGVPSLFGSY
jgi:hypothetical protein